MILGLKNNVMNDNGLNIRCIFLYSFISFLIWSIGFVVSFLLPFESVYNLDCELIPSETNTSTKLTSSQELTILVIGSNLKCIAINTLGFVSFGFTTFLNLLFNGFVHGFSIRFWTNLIGIEALNRILPHSFELVGIFLSGGVGFLGVSFIIKFLCGNDNIVRSWIFTSSFFTILACLIIIVAGFIEGYVSLYI